MRRKIGLFLVFGAVLPLAAASVAWACGVLATVSLNTKLASPGQTVTVTGKNYSAAGNASEVTLRLKNRKGTVLTTAVPSANGKIDKTFNLPASLSPGWYTVMATQTVDGKPKAGTPGRTNMRIQGAARSSQGAAAVAPWGSSNPSGPGGSAPVAGDGGGQPVLPTVLAMVLSLAMLAGGWTLVGRRRRTVTGPQLGV